MDLHSVSGELPGLLEAGGGLGRLANPPLGLAGSSVGSSSGGGADLLESGIFSVSVAATGAGAPGVAGLSAGNEGDECWFFTCINGEPGGLRGGKPDSDADKDVFKGGNEVPALGFFSAW